MPAQQVGVGLRAVLEGYVRLIVTGNSPATALRSRPGMPSVVVAVIVTTRPPRRYLAVVFDGMRVARLQ